MANVSPQTSAALAKSLLQAGRLPEAAAAYRALLAVNPNIAEFHNELGKILVRLSQKDAALDSISKCVALAPQFAEGHNNLGNVLREFGKCDEAMAEYRRALDLDPNYVLAHYNLGNALRAAGRLDEAIDHYRQAIRLHPGFSEAHNNLGNALGDMERWEEAVEVYRRLLQMNPNNSLACNNLGGALHRLGKIEEAEKWIRKALQFQPRYATAIASLGRLLKEKQDWPQAAAVLEEGCRLLPQSLEIHLQCSDALRAVDRFADAVAISRQAVALKPDSSEAINSLGNSLWSNGEFDAAAEAFTSALKLRPDDVTAMNNLAGLLGDRGNLGEAMAMLQKSLQISPDFPGALFNYAVALAGLNRFDEAIGYYRKALNSRPDFAQAHHGVAQIHLVRGEFEQGLRLYEWRRRLPGRPRPFPNKEWKGESWQGRQVVLLDEEGLGDSIQFIRYARLVAEKGAEVTAVCAPALSRVFSWVKGVDRVVPRGTLVDRHDFHVPLLSLPLAMGTRLETIPANVPYIEPPLDQIAHWKKRLEVWASEFKVGLAWAGNPAHKRDRYRSIPPSLLAPLSQSGARFISLQKTTVAPQFTGMPPFDTENLGPELHDLSDTAGLIANLDLVITVDTSIAHLAGALGRPVWVFIPFAPDWRWLLDREDSPWYPTMRLFRQSTIGDWSGPIAKIAEELAATVANRQSGQSFPTAECENSGGSGATNVMG